MSRHDSNVPVERWRDAPDAAPPSQARAAALVAQLAAPPPLSAAQLARIEERLEAKLRRARAPVPAWLKWAIGAGAFGGAPLAFAAVLRLVLAPAAPDPAPAPGQRGRPAQLAPQPPVKPPEPAGLGLDLSQAPEPPAPGAPDGIGKRPPRPPAVPRPSASAAPAEQGTSLKDESALLASALARLRVQRDPAGALDDLDEYRRRFPRGTLRDEERVGRIDALLALGRRPEVLAELEAIGTGIEQLPRGAELRVLEAELLADQGRCAEARPLFDMALFRPLPAPAAERALYGRASCRAQGDDPDGAAADLRSYLERYPTGRFAGAARTLLTRVGGD